MPYPLVKTVVIRAFGGRYLRMGSYESGKLADDAFGGMRLAEATPQTKVNLLYLDASGVSLSR